MDFMWETYIVIIIINLLIANVKNKNMVKIFFLSLFFGFFVTIYLIFAKPNKTELRCSNCKKDISEEDEHCPHCGAEFNSDDLICKKCKTKNKKSNKFCSKCGNELKKKSKHEFITNEDNKSKPFKFDYWFFGGICFIMGLLFLYFSLFISSIFAFLLLAYLILNYSGFLKENLKIEIKPKINWIIIISLIILIILSGVIQNSRNDSNNEVNNKTKEIIEPVSCQECIEDTCIGKLSTVCQIDGNCSKKIEEGYILNKCGVECLNNSDCKPGYRCANYECCSDPCREDYCLADEFVRCDISSDSCNKAVILGLTKGKCGVKCITNSDCNLGMRCDATNHECAYYNMKESLIEGSFKWTFSTITTSKQIGGEYLSETAGQGATFLMIWTTVENIGKTAETFSSSFVKVVDDEGREFDSHISYMSNQDLTYIDKINPGIKRSGFLIYEVPEDLKIANIKISSSYTFDSFKQLRTII